jgi:hypothetical protein
MSCLAIPTGILGVFPYNNEILITRFPENLYIYEPMNFYESFCYLLANLTCKKNGYELPKNLKLDSWCVPF